MAANGSVIYWRSYRIAVQAAAPVEGLREDGVTAMGPGDAGYDLATKLLGDLRSHSLSAIDSLIASPAGRRETNAELSMPAAWQNAITLLTETHPGGDDSDV